MSIFLYISINYNYYLVNPALKANELDKKPISFVEDYFWLDKVLI